MKQNTGRWSLIEQDMTPAFIFNRNYLVVNLSISVPKKKFWGFTRHNHDTITRHTHSGRVRVDSDHIGFLNVHPMHSPQPFLHLPPIERWPPEPGIEPTTPCLECNATAAKPPRWVTSGSSPSLCPWKLWHTAPIRLRPVISYSAAECHSHGTTVADGASASHS